MSGPLMGFRIIDLCRAGPGQEATGYLADYGADVITIVERGLYERRTAGGANAPEAGRVNRRNKRSMFLNLKAPGAKEVFLKLAGTADGLLESNRPGVVKRLGIDYEAVKAIRPSIVYCSLSGFGQTSPYANIAAHDLSYQGIAGMIPLDEHGRPHVPVYTQADFNAAYFGAMALLMGLLGSAKTGRGQYIDVAFTDVSVTIPPGGMADEGLRGPYPAYQVYETKDGRYLTLSVREPWFWERLCKLMEHEEWISHIRPQGAQREEMLAFFRQYFKGKTLTEWLQVLRENDLQFGPLNRTIEEMAADPHLRAREMVLETTHPVTGARSYEPGFAFKFSATPASVHRGPTTMGSDTADVLRELGYSSADVSAMRQAGMV